MEFDRRYKNLNTAQRQAVETIDGPVMVLAGPGTGKTELLAVRVANILKKTDTLPENILCLTYTDSGVVAMRERLISIIGDAAYKVAIHTFHSFGSDVMARNRDYFYHGALFRPSDSASTYEILRAIFSELPFSDPLSSTMNGDYTYQSDAQQVISELKRAGLTSGELLTILDAGDVAVEQIERVLSPILSERMSKAVLPRLETALNELQVLPSEPALYGVPSLMTIVIDELTAALATDGTPAMTRLKAHYFTKNGDGELVMKAREQQKKLRSVSRIYDRYLEAMERAGLYDYDDMILQVVHAMEVNDELRFNVQEQYQYLLVDEFQDTNLAQLRILKNLTDSPVNEGRPNIFVVGDDDQAIYSFQGADISNIRTFTDQYPATERIVLSENYRSTQEILDRAAFVVNASDKQLTAVSHEPGTIETVVLSDSAHEREWVSEAVKQAIDSGTSPTDIAVLLHHHRDIEAVLPYFTKRDIAVSYERRDNVFTIEPIAVLLQLAQVIQFLARNQIDEAEALLPELIAHPAWGFAAQAIWKLSLEAYNERRHWLDLMEDHEPFQVFRDWLIERVADAHHMPLEELLDRLTGLNEDGTPSDQTSLYHYYFSTQALERDPTAYVLYLDALRTLRTNLTGFRPDQPLTLASLVEFVNVYQQSGQRIQLTTQVATSDSAVHLMTAHSAKGLEFDTVFVMSVTDRDWGEKAQGRSRLISYPANLALAPNDNSYEERQRLFYVALTRAKRHLTVSFARQDDHDRTNLPAPFIAMWPLRDIPTHDDIATTTERAKTAWYQPLLEPHRDLTRALQPVIERYKLSATHLGSFLDLSHGGPSEFVALRLLKFPQTPSPQISYGSAIHRTLLLAHTHMVQRGVMQPIEDTLADFEAQLTGFRLSKNEFEKYLQKGSEELTAYLKQRRDTFSSHEKPELDLAHQDSRVGDAHLTGTLDLADIDTKAKTITVYDYKTGRASLNWTGKTEPEKIKLHKYRQQLLFYKLLVEHARDYNQYTVTSAHLEFIQPTGNGTIVTLPLEFDEAELARFSELVQKVWQHIITLNLPDTSAYPPTLKGIQAFEQDLIDGSI